MRLGKVLWTILKPQCGFCGCNRLIYFNTSTFKLLPFSYKLNLVSSSLVKEITRHTLPYSTNTNVDSKKNEASEMEKATQSKKKKEIKVYITLLGTDGNVISVSTVEDATKLASRRNLRLVKVMDLDPKTGRAVYKLMTESEYLKGDMGWEDPQLKKGKGKEKSIKGDKVVSLSSTTADHDVLTKTKMMLKWLEKKFEVRVVITGDVKIGENVYKIIENEIGANGRIVQKRNKGQDIRFQILPPKRFESPKKAEQLPKAEE